MTEFFSSGLAFDVVLGFMVVEALALAAWRYKTGRGLAAGEIAGVLLPGLFLLLALRSVVAGSQWMWISAFLLAALVAHMVDLRRRWRA